MMDKARTIRMFVIVAVAVVGLAFNVMTLWEAYGSSAPYYGRTTNMDKWGNPWPGLIITDLVVLAICWLVWRFGRR